MTKHCTTCVKQLCAFLLLLLLALPAPAQTLKPGFDKNEFIELLNVSAMQLNANRRKGMQAPTQYTRHYRSPETGLDNRWELWTSKDGVGVISIRGTTGSSTSWLENFYAAMVPAKGELQLDHNTTFTYQLAENPKAAVHTGWLLGLAFLSQDILPKVDSCQKAGMKEFIILGHSQGGAIAYLLTSHLKSLQQQDQLPADLRFKTYCSAAPKPGNLYYAYEYEAATQHGWAYNVVNSADWVPETPISVQTQHDFNQTNPFSDAGDMIQKQDFPNNVALRYIYNRLNKHPRKAQKKHEKYLGRLTTRLVQKNLKGFERPSFANTSNYARAGNMIVLLADEAYYTLYPDNKDRVFVHHNLAPYLYLAKQLPD